MRRMLQTLKTPPGMNPCPPLGQKKAPDVSVGGIAWDPGSDLLSPGLRPNYHRRRAFSLPSSERDRVVPARYDRQENCRPRRRSQPRRHVRNFGNAILCVASTELRLLGCYMVKPHGQL